tara:strand:- start:1291 stop:1413 length:123 start_codon:yes stop_codon:yes gene_type:complete
LAVAARASAEAAGFAMPASAGGGEAQAAEEAGWVEAVANA